MHWIYAHLIGDFIFQNDWMASNKKQSTFHCLVHIMMYMLPFLLCDMSWCQLGLIAVQHYAIDRTGFVFWFMNAKGQDKFAGEPCAPWSIIVMDQILHILWMALVASLAI